MLSDDLSTNVTSHKPTASPHFPCTHCSVQGDVPLKLLLTIHKCLSLKTMVIHGIIHKYFRNITIEPMGWLRNLLLHQNIASKGNICSMFDNTWFEKKIFESGSIVEYQKCFRNYLYSNQCSFIDWMNGSWFFNITFLVCKINLSFLSLLLPLFSLGLQQKQNV